MIPDAVLKQLHDEGFRGVEEGKCSECGKLVLGVVNAEKVKGALHPMDAEGSSCASFSFVPLEPPVTYEDPEPEAETVDAAS